MERRRPPAAARSEDLRETEAGEELLGPLLTDQDLARQ